MLYSETVQVVLISLLLLIPCCVAVYFIAFFYNRRVLEQQKELYEIQIRLQEAERIRIGRELHDHTSPFLSGLQHYQVTNNNFDPFLTKLIDQTIEAVRVASHNLSPPGLSDRGLHFSIKSLVENVFINVADFQLDFPNFDLSLTDIGNLHLYRIYSELISNAVKHSKATLISVGLQQNDQELVIWVKDNGKGMDRSTLEYSEGLGWQNIKSRVKLLSGNIKMTTNKHGTEIFLHFPIKRLAFQ